MSPRKRIGVMIPSTNTTCEADFQLTVPRDVTIHGQRLWMTNEGTGDAAYVRMNGEIESGARYLATAHVDVVVYGCTTGSFYKGPGWDTEMLELIRREAKVPAVATSPSVVEALRFFGARRLSHQVGISRTLSSSAPACIPRDALMSIQKGQPLIRATRR